LRDTRNRFSSASRPSRSRAKSRSRVSHRAFREISSRVTAQVAAPKRAAT
jgi:hypothetical protein